MAVRSNVARSGSCPVTTTYISFAPGRSALTMPTVAAEHGVRVVVAALHQDIGLVSVKTASCCGRRARFCTTTSGSPGGAYVLGPVPFALVVVISSAIPFFGRSHLRLVPASLDATLACKQFFYRLGQQALQGAQRYRHPVGR